MPKLKSAEKRMRTSEERRLRNKKVSTRLKNAVQVFERALEEEEQENLQETLRAAISAIDKAVSKGVLHRNTAARKKSRLHRLYNESTRE